MITSTAHLSTNEKYRYSLTRTWNPDLHRATFVMLNPSTADAVDDDPTIRRCMKFAASWGCGGIHVVNLYAYRSTHPANLWTQDDPVGPDNDLAIASAANYAALRHAPIVAAWGNNARPDRVERVLGMIPANVLTALGVTLSGAPKHPLARGRHRIPDDVVLLPWPPNEASA